MKKFFKMLIVSVLTLAFMVPNVAFAQTETNMGNFDFQSAYSWALDVGFPESFLDGISEDMLKQVYLDNFAADGIVVGEEEVQYLKESSPEPQGSIRPQGTISVNHMSLRSLPVKHTTSDGRRITKVVIYVTAEWLNGRPYTHATDGLVVNWDSSIWNYSPNSFTGKIESVHNTGGTPQVDYTTTRLAESTLGGLGWYIPLANYIPYGYTPTVRTSFTLTPRDTSLPEGNRYQSQVSYTYAHKSYGLSVSISASGPSVSVSNYNDHAASACIIEHG